MLASKWVAIASLASVSSGVTWAWLTFECAVLFGLRWAVEGEIWFESCYLHLRASYFDPARALFVQDPGGSTTQGSRPYFRVCLST